MTDLTSFPEVRSEAAEIVTAWQIPEPRPMDQEKTEAEAAITSEASTEARLIDLLGW